MALTGQQIKQLQQALLDGFPSKAHLEMMVRIELDRALDAIAEADNNSLRAYKLITWAESTGNVRALIVGAAAQNEGNPLVARLAKDSRSWALDVPVAPIDLPAAEPGPAAPSAGQAQDLLDLARRQYVGQLHDRYKYLDFKGMGMSDRMSLQLPLTLMYVPLKARVELPEGETWARELRLAGRRVTKTESEAMGERLSGSQSVLDLFSQRDGLVILGDPGSGKTTFLKYLTVMLTQDQGAAVGMAGRLPVLVPLSAYANALAQGDISLQAFMGQYYRNRGIDLPVDRLIDDALAHGRALVMLDGLDEVQATAQRSLVVERVETFCDYQRKLGNKFVITSRIVGYREVRLAAEGLAECTLVDFDDDDIVLFLEKWMQALEQAAKGASIVSQLEAAEEKAELLFALERNPGVRELAANPLLLTILALMKRQGVLLPERRVQLYDQYVQTLLRHWNLSRGLDRRVARDLDVLETTRVLAPLALWMHETSPGVGLVKSQRMRRRLEEIYSERHVASPQEAAQQLLRDARDHASLLLERGQGEYGFIHLTFQEYLAAMAIAQRGQSDLTPVVDLLASHIEDAAWHEVSLLTIGYMGIVQQRDEAAGQVLARLIEMRAGQPGAAVVLAGESVVDTWPGGVAQQCRGVVEAALQQTMTDSANVAPAIRARAGSLVGALGDPRDLGEMVPVPAGSFLMGSNKKKDELAYDDEMPQHTLTLPAFCIGKYPVTNSQYAAFVAATGHAAPSHWRGNQPPPELRNHPVVNVSWHDAVDYCAWLSQALSREMRLPTEAEWERAARHTDGRIYPWEGDFDAGRCNMRDTGIGGTSPVGIFPTGDAVCGASDMAGNVWEWTSSLWGKAVSKPEFGYPYDPKDGRENLNAPDSVARVLRGGSFWGDAQNVRCAYRYWSDPDSRNDSYGFRVVSPGF